MGVGDELSLSGHAYVGATIVGQSEVLDTGISHARDEQGALGIKDHVARRRKTIEYESRLVSARHLRLEPGLGLLETLRSNSRQAGGGSSPEADYKILWEHHA